MFRQHNKNIHPRRKFINCIFLHLHPGQMKVFNVEVIINYMYYSCMFFITIDRLLAALLNLSYRVHCTIERARNVVIFQWLGAAILFGVLWVTNPFFQNR